MRQHAWLIVVPILGLCGCAQRGTRIDLTTYDEGGRPQQHYAEFREAYYRQSAGGLIEVVLRVERPSTIDPTQLITQILYIKSFWNPQPGRTYVEATQINSRIQYAMLTPPTGVRYDGSAFLTYRIDRSGDLIGEVESATFSPRFRMGDAVEPFGPARFTGTIRAENNPGKVLTTAHLLQTQFSERAAVDAP